MNTFRAVRDVLVMVACVCLIFWTFVGVRILFGIGSAADQISHDFGNTVQDYPTPDVPAPTLTGCPPPLAPTDCGG